MAEHDSDIKIKACTQKTLSHCAYKLLRYQVSIYWTICSSGLIILLCVFIILLCDCQIFSCHFRIMVAFPFISGFMVKVDGLQKYAGMFLRNLSLVMRKLDFCICEKKDADQLHSNCAADQRLCFRYTDSTIPLLPKSEISSL